MSEKTCFVIAPIGDPDTEVRKRSDQILKHVITPAVEECGYTPVRADQISEPGIITSQIIQHIVEDPLVIADLTGQNPNVFYELAIRHALKKALVQIIKKGEKIPFDVAGTRTILVDHQDLDSVAEAKEEIIKQIKTLEEGAEIQTPISVALDLQILSRSEDPVLQALYTIQQTVLTLQLRFEHSEASREQLWLDERTILLAQEEELEAKKADLITQMRSGWPAQAVAAAEELRRRGCLYDGSLQEVNLRRANLPGADLHAANLRETDLTRADLQEADLRWANLQGAILKGANLQEADLRWADLREADMDEDTTLPDGTKWKDDTDISRFTGLHHWLFWPPPRPPEE